MPTIVEFLPRVTGQGRVERGSFTLTLSQNRAWKSPLTRLFTLHSLCINITLGSDLSATLTTATFPTAAACRGFDASACTPTPRALLSSHWQLRLHLIWKVAKPFIYRYAPRGTRTGSLQIWYVDDQLCLQLLHFASRNTLLLKLKSCEAFFFY